MLKDNIEREVNDLDEVGLLLVIQEAMKILYKYHDYSLQKLYEFTKENVELVQIEQKEEDKG